MANEEKMRARAPLLRGRLGPGRTLAGAIREMAERGFTHELKVTGDRLEDLGARRSFRASEVVDTSVLYAIEAADGTRGVLVDGYGAYADPAVASFLSGVAVEQRAVKNPQVTPPSYEKRVDR